MKKTLIVLFIISAICLNTSIIEKTYHFDNYNISKIDGYQTIEFENAQQEARIGEPVLPYISVSLLLPPCEIVETIEILSNYPNPFNPETTISFSLASESTENTEINIFNIKGQKVRTLPVNLSGDEGAGQVYSVSWNGTDQNNQPVASGIYFYQLNVDDKVIASKKCLLLK